MTKDSHPLDADGKNKCRECNNPTHGFLCSPCAVKANQEKPMRGMKGRVWRVRNE